MEQQALALTPASRRSDPGTSHAAESEINATGLRGKQQRQVRDAVRAHPGRTSRELAEVTGLDRYMLGRRLPEIEPVHVRKGDARKCTAGNRPAVTWWPA